MTKAEDIDEASLARVFANVGRIDLLVLGTGQGGWIAPEPLRWRLSDLRVGVEIMPTSAAIRTYNVLQDEGRRVGAALIAVE